MGAVHTQFHHPRREVKPGDITRHIITGSTQGVMRLLYEVQEDLRWVERCGDSAYFRAFFLNIRQSAQNMVVFEVLNTDRKMAEQFDAYLVAKVGELDLHHSQPVPQAKEEKK